jgi:hypothetical protein
MRQLRTSGSVGGRGEKFPWSTRPPGARSNVQDSDRVFWILMMRMLMKWKDAVHFVKPETVIKWHRKGFRYYLEAQVDGQTWQTAYKQGAHPFDPTHVHRELGLPSYCRATVAA